MDQATFQQAIGYLAAAYDAEITPERAAVYWDQLGGLRDEPFLTACRVAVGSLERFPTVAQLREQYRAELRRLSLSPQPRLGGPPANPERVASMLRSLRRRLGPPTRS